MGKAAVIYREVRFVIADEQTHCYMLLEAVGDVPMSLQGWHYKAFPPTTSLLDVLQAHARGEEEPMLWPQVAPPARNGEDERGHCARHDLRWSPGRLGCPACQDEKSSSVPLDAVLAPDPEERRVPIRKGGTVSDRAELDTTIGPDGMQSNYLVLSEEERAKGFVRPVRRSYRHVGIAGPQFPLRDLSQEEQERYQQYGYVKHEDYPESMLPRLGRYWTQRDLDRVGQGCGTVTTMAQALAETYARDPSFYGATFCAGCRNHSPVGAAGEFVWEGTQERVGT